jgi:hypothetical protein
MPECSVMLRDMLCDAVLLFGDSTLRICDECCAGSLVAACTMKP